LLSSKGSYGKKITRTKSQEPKKKIINVPILEFVI